MWTLTRIFDGLPVDGGTQVIINVPDLTGSSQAEALNDLQSLGFKVGIENSAHPEVPLELLSGHSLQQIHQLTLIP